MIQLPLHSFHIMILILIPSALCSTYSAPILSDHFGGHIIASQNIYNSRNSIIRNVHYPGNYNPKHSIFIYNSTVTETCPTIPNTA